MLKICVGTTYLLLVKLDDKWYSAGTDCATTAIRTVSIASVWQWADVCVCVQTKVGFSLAKFVE